MFSAAQTQSQISSLSLRSGAAVRTPLVQHSFGPWPLCQALVWEQLVDFAQWAAWMPDVKAVNRVDSGPVGRGSRIQVDRPFHTEFWEIIHWHHQQRFDFEVSNTHCRVGFSVTLTEGVDADHVIVTLESEGEARAGGRVLAWLGERRLQRSGIAWLAGFGAFFNAQKPPVC